MDATAGWLTLIETWLVMPSMTRTIVLSLLISFSGTQWIKRWGLPVLDLWRKFPPPVERLALVLVAFVTAAGPAIMLGAEWWVAASLGVASPSVYKIAVAAAYKFFPWLEPKLSAQSLKRIHEAGDRTIMAPRDTHDE